MNKKALRRGLIIPIVAALILSGGGCSWWRQEKDSSAEETKPSVVAEQMPHDKHEADGAAKKSSAGSKKELQEKTDVTGNNAQNGGKSAESGEKTDLTIKPGAKATKNKFNGKGGAAPKSGLGSKPGAPSKAVPSGGAAQKEKYTRKPLAPFPKTENGADSDYTPAFPYDGYYFGGGNSQPGTGEHSGSGSTDVTPPQPAPQPKIPAMNEISTGKLHQLANGLEKNRYLVYRKPETETLAQATDKILAAAVSSAKNGVYFVRPYTDENIILAIAPSSAFDFGKLPRCRVADLPVKAGIWVSQSGQSGQSGHATTTPPGQVQELHLLSHPKENEPIKADVVMTAGKVKCAAAISGNLVIGLPGNESHLSVVVTAATGSVSGINFYASDTELPPAANNAAISLTKEKLDVDIENNQVFFAGKKAEMALGIVAFSMQGRVNITNNKFYGKNLAEQKHTENYGVINTMSKAKNELNLQIKNNEFTDIASTAVNIMIGDKEDVNIIGNKVNGTDDNGILVNIFPQAYPKFNKLTIENNEIGNYGRGKYEGFSDGGAGKLMPSNQNELGISLQYVEPTYGSKVNGTWVSNADELKELLNRQNKIMPKAENDLQDNVVDSQPVGIGHKNKFIDTKKYINKPSRLSRRASLVITKNENGTVTYGQSSEDPTAGITVKNLYITGKGSGTVILPTTLHITDDLIIDLPNGQVQNNAVIGGKTVIKAQSEIKNDAVFSLSPEKIIRGSAPAQGIIITVSNIKNDAGTPIAASESKLNGVKVYVDGKLLAEEKYTVDEAADKIILKPSTVNALTDVTNIKVSFSDPAHKVSELMSQNLVLQIVDNSKAEFTMSDNSFTHMNPENKEIAVQVKNLHDKTGKPVDAATSQLQAYFERSGFRVDQQFLRVDDATDTVYLTKDLLASLPATKYSGDDNQSFGDTSSYTLIVEDRKNDVGQLKKKLEFEITDKSKANFSFESGMTFTQGKAPAEGIKVFVRDILNTSGNKVTPAQSVLQNNINIEPFPVRRSASDDSELIVERDSKGQFIRERFNPKYLIIDDAADTITFTQEYLNHMKVDTSTESGVKTFTFVYHDEKARVDMRSGKIPLYIKKAELPRSKTTAIAFETGTVALKGNEIVAAGQPITSESTVESLLKWVRKINPRQRVFIQDAQGKIKPYFYTLTNGDTLVVVAEDGESKVTYKIQVAEVTRPALIKAVDKAYIFSYTNTLIRYKQGIKVKEFTAAITCEPGVEAQVLSYNRHTKDYRKAVGEATLQDKYILRMIRQGKNYDYILCAERAGKRVARVLLVGNHDYAGEKMDLIGPPNDLRMMEAVFRGNRLANTQTEVNIAKNVTKKEFMSALNQAFSGATEDDVSYLYYSGHGNNVNGISYLCTVDNLLLKNGSFDPKAWVSVDELKAALDRVPGKKVLILDCCNAGGFIGKAAIDGVSTPTPHAGGTAVVPQNSGIRQQKITTFNGLPQSDTSVAFIKDVNATFRTEASAVNRHALKEVQSDRANASMDRAADQPRSEYYKNLNYLTDNPYKVLVASSANEYSFEDKKEGVGKFTKTLAIAAGLENSVMKGDLNKDRKLSLDEAYKYLTGNVASISHIQVYPFNDQFTLFENVDVTPLSRDTKISSTVYKVSIRVNRLSGKCRGTITAQAGEVIDAEQTVAEFIAKFKKGEEHQVLAVKEIKNPGASGGTKTLAEAEKLGERFLYLSVTAQNGDETLYPFSAKRPAGHGKAASTKISSTDAQKVKIIQQGPVTAIKVTGNMTVAEFLQKIKRDDPAQQLQVCHKGPAGEAVVKATTEALANLDWLNVISPDKSQTTRYNITLLAGSVPGTLSPDAAVPDFGDNFIVRGKEIVSGKMKLTDKMTVGEFLTQLKNRAQFAGYDTHTSGIYASGTSLESPFAMRKRPENKLANGDRLVFKPGFDSYPGSQPPLPILVYTLNMDAVSVREEGMPSEKEILSESSSKVANDTISQPVITIGRAVGSYGD